MDNLEANPPADRRTTSRFGPDRRLTALSVGGAVITGASAALTHDAGGRLLWIVAAAILAVYAVTDIAFSPRITATAEGLVLRSPGTARVSWNEVEAVRAHARQHLGLRSVTLEIDTANGLHVFSRRALGADPEHVAAVLAALDPRR